MNVTLKDELVEVASTILETIVFAFTEPLDGLPRFDAESFLTAKVAFSGSFDGTLSVTAPKCLCEEWAEMMSTKHTETIHLDTLAELANIVAGHWVSRHFSEKELPKLNPPRVSCTTVDQWDEFLFEPSLALLSVDGRPLILTATISS